MIWQKLYMGSIYGFLYLPLIILILFSFNDSAFTNEWSGASLKWYKAFFANTELIRVSLHSLLLAILSASLATIMGSFISLFMHFFALPMKGLVRTLIFILLLSPDLVMGIALLILFVGLSLEPGFLSLLVAHITFCIPFVVVTTLARLEGFDRSILEAAYDLGASDAQAIRLVLLPILAPALLSSWLLSFTLSMDDVVISFFVSGPSYEVLPLKIYSMVRLGIKPEVNALCTIIFCLSLALVVLSRRLVKEDD